MVGDHRDEIDVDDVVKAFDNDEVVVLDELTVAGFLQLAGLLGEVFEAAMEAIETVCAASYVC